MTATRLWQFVAVGGPDEIAMPLFRETDRLERRRAPRRPVDAGVFCEILDSRDGSSYPAAIRDISQTGIALLSEHQLEIGEVFTIQLHHPERGLFRKYLLEVRHSDICCPNDAFLHGCRFALPLRIEEMRAWL